MAFNHYISAPESASNVTQFYSRSTVALIKKKSKLVQEQTEINCQTAFSLVSSIRGHTVSVNNYTHLYLEFYNTILEFKISQFNFLEKKNVNFIISALIIY